MHTKYQNSGLCKHMDAFVSHIGKGGTNRLGLLLTDQLLTYVTVHTKKRYKSAELILRYGLKSQ